MFRILKEEKFRHGPITLAKGDTLRGSISHEGRIIEATEVQIEKPMIADRIVLFEFENELGLQHGMGAVFGFKNE